MSKLETTRPPWLARILSRLISGPEADALRGDLDESFQRLVATRGNTFSVRVAYTGDVLWSVAHWWWSALFRARNGSSSIVEDAKLGVRLLAKNPVFTLVAIISLAVGIGTTTTVFGLLSAAIFRPLPIGKPDGLVTVQMAPGATSALFTLSYPDYLQYRTRADVFSEVLAWTEVEVAADVDGDVEQSYGMLASGNYFSMLGVRPGLGRFFTAEEDRNPGENPVVVLGNDYWRRRFGGDSSVVGRGIELNGQRYTIIGVAPKGFTSTYSVFAPVFYVPLTMQGHLRSRPDMMYSRGSSNLKVTGRLEPGVTYEQAEAALGVLNAQLENEDVKRRDDETRSRRFAVDLLPVGAYPLDLLLGLFGVAALLLGIVGSVLLIACANVAGMLLARATVRRREMAVRVAMGATRSRLIRQLLMETGVLFFTAATLGVILASWLTRLSVTVPLPIALPFALDASVDWRVLSFTLVLALSTAIAFGLAPALETSRVDVHTALKDAPATPGVKRSRLRHAFVVAQITLSLVLLICAGLFTRALRYGEKVFLGREPESVLTATLNPEPLGFNGAQSREIYQRLTERISALPGVEGVSFARFLQVGDSYATTSLTIRDKPELGEQKIETNTIAPGYFRTLGARVVAGREFSTADRVSAPPVVIVNEAAARRFWPGVSAVGKQVRLSEDKFAEVIGVVEDGPHRISGKAAPPFVYSSFFQGRSDNVNMTMLVRYRGDKADIVSGVRRETQAIERRLPLQLVQTLSAAVTLVTLPWRIAGGIATVFGIIGLTLAALGIYGLVAYTVSQRTHEIGVRIALGADPFDIRKLVIQQGLKLAFLGVTIGLVLSFGVTQALASFLFGISASDPLTYVGQALVLVAVALGASYLPARRATMTDPLVALRHE